MDLIRYETDVLIAGGGPAGLATAIAARQRGLRAAVVEPARPPIDKACGEGVLPGGVESLRKLGIAPAAGSGVAFPGIRFVQDREHVQAAFPRGAGLGMRRTELHGLMVKRAAECGVRLDWGSSVRGLVPGGVLVNGETVRCRWIVGADGQNSRVRQWAGLNRYREHYRRFGFRRHYRMELADDFVEVHWHDRAQLYVTPVGSGEACVALICEDPHLRMEEALGLFPEVRKRLGERLDGPAERGSASLFRTLGAVLAKNIALVGDASGSVDAITGAGMSLAFREAEALADALAGGDLRPYAAAHRRITALPWRMSRLTLLLDKYPALRRRLLHALAAKPDLFSGLLAIHVGQLSPAQFGLSRTFSLGWQLLTA